MKRSENEKKIQEEKSKVKSDQHKKASKSDFTPINADTKFDGKSIPAKSDDPNSPRNLSPRYDVITVGDDEEDDGNGNADGEGKGEELFFIDKQAKSHSFRKIYQVLKLCLEYEIDLFSRCLLGTLPSFSTTETDYRKTYCEFSYILLFVISLLMTLLQKPKEEVAPAVTSGGGSLDFISLSAKAFYPTPSSLTNSANIDDVDMVEIDGGPISAPSSSLPFIGITYG